VLEFLLSILAAGRVFFRSRGTTALEILALRQQVAVLKRKRPRPSLTSLDRLFWTTLRSVWSRWTDVLVVVKPETVVGWHRAGFRLYWRWRSRPRGGRPKSTEQTRALIRRTAEENATWGAPTRYPRAEWVLQQERSYENLRPIGLLIRRVCARQASWATLNRGSRILNITDIPSIWRVSAEKGWLVEWHPIGTVNMVSAESGTRKSWMAYGFSGCVARGEGSASPPER